MRRSVLLILLVVAVVVVFATSGAATEPADTSMVRELAGLNRSLESIAEALHRLERKQDIVLLLRRMEIKERRTLTMESALRGAQGTLQSMKNDFANMKSYADSVTKQIDVLVREGPVGPQTEEAIRDLRREEAELLRLIESRQPQLDEQELRIRELEDDLEDLRDEVDDLEELLETLSEL